MHLKVSKTSFSTYRSAGLAEQEYICNLCYRRRLLLLIAVYIYPEQVYIKAPSKEVTITNPILDGCNNNAFKYERTHSHQSP